MFIIAAGIRRLGAVDVERRGERSKLGADRNLSFAELKPVEAQAEFRLAKNILGFRDFPEYLGSDPDHAFIRQRNLLRDTRDETLPRLAAARIKGMVEDDGNDGPNRNLFLRVQRRCEGADGAHDENQKKFRPPHALSLPRGARTGSESNCFRLPQRLGARSAPSRCGSVLDLSLCRKTHSPFCRDRSDSLTETPGLFRIDWQPYPRQHPLLP